MVLAIDLSGGNRALAYYTFLVLLPGGAMASGLLRRRVSAQMICSLTIAVVEWPLIVRQYLNPLLVLARVDSPSVMSTTGQLISDASGLRPTGNTVDPNLVATFLLAGIFLAWPQANASKWSRAVGVLLISGNVAMLGLTGSRTGILTLGMFAMFLLLRRFRTRVMSIAFIGGLFALALVVTSLGAKRVGPSTRFEILRAAWPVIERHFPRGIGWGNTDRYVYDSIDGTIYQLHFLPAHLLLELGGFGLLGATIILSFCCARWSLSALLSLPFVIFDAGVFIDGRTAVMIMLALGLAGEILKGDNSRPCRVPISNIRVMLTDELGVAGRVSSGEWA